jgi:DNA invertase Pin-like site-specific DNA recombinase
MSVEQKPDKSRHVALYERVSTETQAEKGVSLDAQAAGLHSTAEARHPTSSIIEYRDEGRSGREGKHRPRFDALCRAIEADQVEHVYATKIDRLARSIIDLTRFLRLCAEHGTGVSTLQTGELMDSAAGRLLRNVLGVIAEFESDLRSERVLDVNDHLRSAGLFVGKPPWGYIRRGRMIVPGADARLILRSFELFAEGHTKTQVMRWLNAQAREERLAPVKLYQVTRLLENPVYAGFVVSKTKSGAPVATPGQHTPIVPRELFDCVQELLVTRKCHGYHGDRLLPFASLARCGKCHAPLRHGSDGDGRHYVSCSAYCGLKAWGAQLFELSVVLHIDAVAAWIGQALADGSWHTIREETNSAVQLLADLETARMARDELKKALRQGALTASEANTELKTNLKEITQLEGAYAAASRTDAEAEAELRDYWAMFPANFTRWWVETSAEERERLLPQLVSRIWLHEHGIGFMPARCFARPLIFHVEYERQRNTTQKELADLGFHGIKQKHDQETATLLRSPARARSADRSRSPPSATRPARG